MTDLKDLREKANSATPGERCIVADEMPGFINIFGNSFRISIVTTATDLNSDDYRKRHADAAFIVASQPKNMLALLDRIEKLEKSLISIKDYAVTKRYQDIVVRARRGLEAEEGT